jgi:hypothetical protein
MPARQFLGTYALAESHSPKSGPPRRLWRTGPAGGGEACRGRFLGAAPLVENVCVCAGRHMAFVEGSLASLPPTPGQGGTHDHCKFLWRGYRAKTVQQRCVHAVASRVAVDGRGYCANGKRDLDRIVRIRARQIALESGARLISGEGRLRCSPRATMPTALYSRLVTMGSG